MNIYFTKNKWLTKNIFLVNWKSSYFSVKYLTDLKNVKYFTSFFSFFLRKIFFRKSFSEIYFFENIFSWNKRNLKMLEYSWRCCYLLLAYSLPCYLEASIEVSNVRQNQGKDETIFCITSSPTLHLCIFNNSNNVGYVTDLEFDI